MGSRRISIGDADFEFIRLVSHASNDETIALLRSCETGELHYLCQQEWEQAGNICRVDAVSNRSAPFKQTIPTISTKTPASTASTQDSPNLGPQTLNSLYREDYPAVTRNSPTKEKIALFRSLFKGREDVYANGYTNRKTGKVNYGPVCTNRKNWNICRLGRGVKCRDCEHRAFIPLSDEALIAHFRGKSERFEDVVGLYVLDDDCHTSVLVADFDEGNWQAEADAFRNAACSFGLDPAIERSRSGAGAHVWIFFEAPIEAQLARDLGFTIITAAMRATGVMDFSSYDRLFPTQSTVQPGGLGNLIALPLQGQAAKQGNSLFVNSEFQTMPDQFAYLSNIKKATAEQVKEIVDHQNNLVRISAASIAPSPTSASPTSVNIVKSDGLHICTMGLPASFKDHIRRLAVFANPNFYRAQAMHRSVYGSPHFIWLFEENEDEIRLPRGCEPDLMNLLRTHNVTPNVSDERPTPAYIDVAFRGTLRNDQQDAFDTLVTHEYGVLSAPTGFGKTVIGANLIAHRKVRTLIIVPRSALIDQWRNSLERFLDLQEELPILLTKTGRRSKNQPSKVGHVGSCKHPANGMIDVATFQSLTEPGEIAGTKRVKNLVHDYDMIICDECHYCAADKLQLILRSVQTRYVYGLSATPRRTDGLERMIYLQCGPIRFSVDPKAQSAAQHFRRLLAPRFTRIRIPDLEPGASFNSILGKLCEHTARNDQIVQDVARMLTDRRTPLVLTRRIEHAELLARRLQQLGHTVFLLTGVGTNKERQDSLAAVQAYPDGQPFAIVATGSYIGEGFDEPRLDTLILATPAASETVITQYSGRLHREHAGKSEVIVYDYVDTTIPMLDQMYRKRLRTYRKLGYEVIPKYENSELTGRFIEPNDCVKSLVDDISAATKSVLLRPIYVNPRFLQLVAPAISDARARGLAVSVCIKQPKSFDSLQRTQEALSMLEAAECEVQIDQSGHFGIAVFDEKIIWYGSLPLLAFGEREDCSLRFESAEVAHDLLAEGENDADEKACC